MMMETDLNIQIMVLLWGGRMKYYISPDGTIADEPLDFMSDDYYVLQADDYEEAYEQALMMGLI